MTSSVHRLAVLFAIFPLLAVVGSPTLAAQTTAKRAVRVGDMYRLRNVGPEISPDGQWSRRP